MIATLELPAEQLERLSAGGTLVARLEQIEARQEGGLLTQTFDVAHAEVLTGDVADHEGAGESAGPAIRLYVQARGG